MVNFPGRSGIWIYNAQTGCYIFMAFYRGFSSPYGYGYPGLLGYPCNSCYIFPYGGGGGGGYSGGYVGGSSGGHGRGAGGACGGDGGGCGGGLGGWGGGVWGGNRGYKPAECLTIKPVAGG